MYLLQDGASQHQQSKPRQDGNLEQPVSQLSLDANQQAGYSLLVFCQTELQPEKATRWLQTLLQAVSPHHILVAASLPVRVLYTSTVGSCMTASNLIVLSNVKCAGLPLAALVIKCMLHLLQRDT